MIGNHSHGEIARLRQVYREYQDDPSKCGQWDPSNLGNREIERERTERLTQLLKINGYARLDSARVLEIGCGLGNTLSGMQGLGVKPENLYGVDLLKDRIEAARKLHPEINFKTANAESLDFGDATFELVLAFTVFSSIFDVKMASNVAGEMIRVLKPGGAVVWYDLRIPNPFNRNVRAISRSELRSLFSGCRMELQTVTLIPPIARRLGPLAPHFYRVMTTIPALRSHYLGLMMKQA